MVESKFMLIDKLEKIDLDNKTFTWKLPPSKSHLQRVLLLSSLVSEEVVIEGITSLGKDSLTMVECLNQMGANIEYNFNKSRIVIGENQKNELRPPISVLDCGNSATTLKLLLGYCCRFDVPIMFDGDETLRKRPLGNFLKELKSAGVEISHGSVMDELPFIIKGPISPREYLIDVSESSQPLSSLIMSGVGAKDSFKIIINGGQVSKYHSELTLRICEKSGANIIRRTQSEFLITPWVPKWARGIQVPGDASLAVYCMLWTILHNESIIMQGWPTIEDTLGCFKLFDISEGIGLNWKVLDDNNVLLSPNNIKMETLMINLQNAIDLLPALAVIFSISSGATIDGISHAAIKESNRIEETQKLLSIFGLKSDLIEGKMVIPGNQIIVKPADVVSIPYDHRIEMAAMILASAVGASIEFNESYMITDPLFVKRLSKLGINIFYE